MHLEVWRALKKVKLLSAAPRATLTLFSCSPNFPRASITLYTHAKHEPILKAAYNARHKMYDMEGFSSGDSLARVLTFLNLACMSMSFRAKTFLFFLLACIWSGFRRFDRALG